MRPDPRVEPRCVRHACVLPPGFARRLPHSFAPARQAPGPADPSGIAGRSHAVACPRIFPAMVLPGTKTRSYGCLPSFRSSARCGGSGLCTPTRNDTRATSALTSHTCFATTFSISSAGRAVRQALWMNARDLLRSAFWSCDLVLTVMLPGVGPQNTNPASAPHTDGSPGCEPCPEKCQIGHSRPLHHQAILLESSPCSDVGRNRRFTRRTGVPPAAATSRGVPAWRGTPASPAPNTPARGLRH